MPIYYSRSNDDQSTRRAKDQNIMKLFARFGLEQFHREDIRWFSFVTPIRMKALRKSDVRDNGFLPLILPKDYGNLTKAVQDMNISVVHETPY